MRPKDKEKLIDIIRPSLEHCKTIASGDWFYVYGKTAYIRRCPKGHLYFTDRKNDAYSKNRCQQCFNMAKKNTKWSNKPYMPPTEKIVQLNARILNVSTPVWVSMPSNVDKESIRIDTDKDMLKKAPHIS